ncbi:MAG: HNH endonuclease [Anaerolineae bacterium]|nr:HNH endonuclease [Anaerolineae bacterium]
MKRSRVPDSVRQRVAELAGHCCGYCQTREDIVAYPLHIDHIIPQAAGGSSAEDNLWLSCSVCNNYKGAQTSGIDPETGIATPLFNPRLQKWADHFAWSDDGTRISGRTATGRATVVALKLNEPFRVFARQLWVEVGWHPPEDLG